MSESQDNFNPSNSQITNGGNSAIVVAPKEEKQIKLGSMSLIQPETKRAWNEGSNNVLDVYIR